MDIFDVYGTQRFLSYSIKKYYINERAQLKKQWQVEMTNDTQNRQEISESSNASVLTNNGEIGGDDSTSRNVNCPICLDDKLENDMVYFQNCTHYVCKECENHISSTSNRCPFCRNPIRNEDVVVKECLERIQTLLLDTLHELGRLRSVDSRHFLENLDSTPRTENENSESGPNSGASTDNTDIRNLLTQTRSALTRVLNGSAETGLFPITSRRESRTGTAPIANLLGGLAGGGPEVTGNGIPNMFAPLISALATMHSVPGMMQSGNLDSNFDAVVSISVPGSGPGVSFHQPLNAPNRQTHHAYHTSQPPTFIDNLRNAFTRFQNR